jgi:pimeloyl-ACP methyl ester carboxylesterase
MSRAEVNGISIAYELIGTGNKAVTITPGGRFSKDTPGVRELAQALAASGYKVLIWDRPNCGESDICFAGECESFQNADTLAGLIRNLGLGKALIIGASGGARESLLTAIRHPDVAAGVFVQWLSGGGIGIATLPISYYGGSALTATGGGGMAAVAELSDWKEPLTRNPANRERMLAMNLDEFIQKLRDWGDYFLPQPGAPIPCVSVADLAGIKVPVVVLRSGKSDFHHTRETSEKVASMIPGAQLQEPPWGDREWLDQLHKSLKGESGLFSRLSLVAPQVLAFAKSFGHA